MQLLYDKSKLPKEERAYMSERAIITKIEEAFGNWQGQIDFSKLNVTENKEEGREVRLEVILKGRGNK